MRKVYDLTVKVRDYQDRQGQTKAEWLSIGAVLENDKGMFAMLKPHVNLAALPRRDGGDVLVSMFEPRDRDNQQRQRAGYTDLDDDIPY